MLLSLPTFSCQPSTHGTASRRSLAAAIPELPKGAFTVDGACRPTTNLYGSKDVTREAFAKELISNGEEWMAMIQARNRSSHTYNEKTAHEVAAAILSSFVTEFEALRVRFTELESREP